jgi:hypothetical protein
LRFHFCQFHRAAAGRRTLIAFFLWSLSIFRLIRKGPFPYTFIGQKRAPIHSS